METVALLYEDYQKELAEDFKNTFLKRASDTDSSRSNDTVIDEVTDMLSTNIAVYTEKLLQRWGFSSGGEGGGGGDVTVTLDDLLKKYLSDNYVTIKGDQEVFGEKDFRKGIRIAGRRLYWDEGNDALVIEGAAYTTRWLSAKGVSPGSGGTGGASALYQLVDVLANDTEDGVEGAAAGKALVFDGTHWRAGDAGLNESQLYSYLTANKYLTQSAADSRYVTSSRKVIAGTGLSGGGALTSDVTLSLGTSGVVAGTYTKVMVDAYGRVTSGTNLSATDIPNLDWSKITTGKPTTLAGYGITDAYTKTEADGKYVTIATAQTVSGAKTFSATMKTSSVLPSADANSELGGTANRWNNIYSVNGTFSQNVTAKLLSASETLQIGDAYLKWDSTNNAVYVIKKDGTTPVGFYSTDWLSAKGVSMSGVQTGTLADLTDVEITNPTNGQALKYDAASKKWVNGTIDSFNVNQMWAELKKADSSKIIDASHIPTSVLDGRWVTLSTNQTITGQKTFTQQLKSTVATGLSPLIVSSNTTVDNLSADLLDGYHAFGTSNALIKYGYTVSGTEPAWCRIATYSIRNTETMTDVCFVLHSAFDGLFGLLVVRTRGGDYVEGLLIASYNINTSNIRIYHDAEKRNIELYCHGGNKYSGIQANLLYSHDRYGEANTNITLYRKDTKAPSWSTYVNPVFAPLQNSSEAAKKLQTPRTLWGQSFDGTANVSGNMTDVGSINMSGQLTSTVASGTAPFIVVSNTVVGNLNADLLDGAHLAGLSGRGGVMRSWHRGRYTTVNQYFGNGNVVTIDPKPTDDATLSPNTTVLSLGDLPTRNTQLAFHYDTNTIKYRRHDDSKWNDWVVLIHSGNYASYSDGRYVKKAGDTMTGDLAMNNTKGIYITHGTRVVKTSGNWIHGGGDTASSTDANLRFGSWNGIGWYPTIIGQSVAQGENAMWLNVRTGVLNVAGGIKESTICIGRVNSAGNYDGAYNGEINRYDHHLFLQHHSGKYLIMCTGGGLAGIGTNSPGEKLHVAGNTRTDGYFKSTVGTGTQPYQCSSTTLNSNLNADLLDGQHGAYYQNRTYDGFVSQYQNYDYIECLRLVIPSGQNQPRVYVVFDLCRTETGGNMSGRAVLRIRRNTDNTAGYSVYVTNFGQSWLPELRCTTDDGITWRVWMKCVKNSYDPYIAVKIVEQYPGYATIQNNGTTGTPSGSKYTVVAGTAGLVNAANVWVNTRTFYTNSHDSYRASSGVSVNGSSNVTLLLPNSIRCSDWFRSTGTTGWYNDTYGGGIYMTDSSYIRNYNSKRLRIQTDTYDTIQLVRTSGSGGASIAFYNNGGTFRGQFGMNATSWFTFDTGTATANQNVVEISPAGGIHSKAEITAKASGSDIRLKKDIQNYNAMDIINKFRSVKYHWNDVAKANSEVYNNDYDQFGLIAQDLIAGGFKQWVRDVFHDYYTVTYERLIPVVWKGLQEVDDEVTKLKREVARLNKRVKELEKSLCA